ncbi:methyltransferase domain-containing protein [Tabrizicola sp.]|uniref:class I SAM-dependent methyltransferase n=1 Tax=Tabrizicola sp. TaxID=2005166 RepID=UPI00286D0233|nr:methyltransferase domain-containing protein [Tabrizicola sp.]
MQDQMLDAGYDRAAGGWAEGLRRLGYDRAYRVFLRRVLAQGHARVCDVGTGAGDLALAYVAVMGAPEDLVLVDASAGMLAVARERLGRGRPVKARLGQFDDAAGFDLVLAGHVIEHCPDPGLAMRQLARLVRPGGQIVLIVSKPHWCQWLIWLRWRHRWFSATSIVELAEAAGLLPDTTLPFETGAPRRTSLGYLFTKPKGETK